MVFTGTTSIRSCTIDSKGSKVGVPGTGRVGPSTHDRTDVPVHIPVAFSRDEKTSKKVLSSKPTRFRRSDGMDSSDGLIRDFEIMTMC